MAVSGLFMVACNNTGNNSSTAKDTINSSTDSTTVATSITTNNKFVYTASAGSMLEVELGKLAQANGGSEGIKNYGKMLEKDHSAANNQLKAIATRENMTLPTAIMPKQKEGMEQILSLTGKEFDKAFIPLMIEDHTKDIAEFREAAESNENASVKAFAEATLPKLEAHLAKAKSLQEKM